MYFHPPSRVPYTFYAGESSAHEIALGYRSIICPSKISPLHKYSRKTLSLSIFANWVKPNEWTSIIYHKVVLPPHFRFLDFEPTSPFGFDRKTEYKFRTEEMTLRKTAETHFPVACVPCLCVCIHITTNIQLSLTE